MVSPSIVQKRKTKFPVFFFPAPHFPEEQNALCARAVSARRDCVSLFYDLYFYVPLRKFNLWDTLHFAGSVLRDFSLPKDPSLFSATRENQTLTWKVKVI